jgi:hypothetical protein
MQVESRERLTRSAGRAAGFALILLVTALAVATVRPAMAEPATGQASVLPHWVYQMINDFNTGISEPSGVLSASFTIYQECVAVPPNFTFVDANSRSMTVAVQTEFAAYGKLIPRWVKLIAKLKSTPVTRLARAKLLASQSLHAQEVTAWKNATAAIKTHDCAKFLGSLKQAKLSGAPDWADQYAAVKAIAGLYGQSGAVSHQTPYAQKLG